MLDAYIYQGNEKLRCGYTTGSCAAGAAKAAAMMLLSKSVVDEVYIGTPKGIELCLEPVDIIMSEEYVSCGIIKDSGDDPDITNGICVYAKVKKIDEGGKVLIKGGQGIGVVTKKGLDQPVGEAAINSVPRKIISECVLEVMEEAEYKNGLEIEISIPGGEEIARKTFNPRLGIEGGLSIIGTTGIVEPMSNSAIIDTIRIEENVLKDSGRKYILITLGNYGKTFLSNEFPEILDKTVTCSNFIGEAVNIAVSMKFENVLIVGHIGKMVKLGAGIMNTHSSNADGRMEVLITCGVLAGMRSDILREIDKCVTVDDALKKMSEDENFEAMKSILMKRIQYYLDGRVKGEIRVGAIVFSNKYGIIGATENAAEIKDKILEEING